MSRCDIALIPYFAELICDERKPERVLALQFDALRQLGANLKCYERRGYLEELIFAIADKKARMILGTTSKGEMEKVLKPNCPHYDGSRFIPGEYSVPEEELICWSETSLQGPLMSHAVKRYMELFKQVLPEQAAALRIE